MVDSKENMHVDIGAERLKNIPRIFYIKYNDWQGIQYKCLGNKMIQNSSNLIFIIFCHVSFFRAQEYPRAFFNLKKLFLLLPIVIMTSALVNTKLLFSTATL